MCSPRRARWPSFNPFFIRASVYWVDGQQMADRLEACVSIPSSSGHQFTGFKRDVGRNPIIRTVSIPSSSGHQFTDTAFIRLFAPKVGFQSLLHQGISLLSSEEGEVKVAKHLSFNPFFIRASVYCFVNGIYLFRQRRKFQSLLHQGISLLGTYGGDRRSAKPR